MLSMTWFFILPLLKSNFADSIILSLKIHQLSNSVPPVRIVVNLQWGASTREVTRVREGGKGWTRQEIAASAPPISRVLGNGRPAYTLGDPHKHGIRFSEPHNGLLYDVHAPPQISPKS